MGAGMTMGLETGDLLEGRYRIFDRIGEGGMGVVYLAEHVALHRKCAVKVLHPSEAGDETMIARFKIEAQAAANIRHPNVVEVMDFGITPDNRPFFVMEYLEGESLADRLDRKGRLSERETRSICEQILGGLAAAHRVRVVHRDLKPENIFMARIDKKTEMVKILDFGISKIVAGTPSRPPAPISADHKVLTQKGIVFGTPGYMAPETLFGTESVDARADLFSVSVLLFEMLVGKRPFQGRDAQSTMLATATAPAPYPTDTCPEISSAMEKVILKGLIKDPAFRFQSADGFKEALLATEKRSLVSRFSRPPAPPKKRPIELAAVTGRRRIDAPSAVNTRLHMEIEQERRKKKRAGFFRGLMVWFSPIPFLFFLGLGGVMYYYFVHQKPMHEVYSEDPIDARISNRNRWDTEASAQSPITSSQERAVTIWIDGTPEKMTIHLNNKEMYERPLIIPESTEPVEMRFSAPGYTDHLRKVIPDQEQTITVRLGKIETKSIRK